MRTIWDDLNKNLTDGESTTVTARDGFFHGVYTRRGEAGFWTHLQHPQGCDAEALNELIKTLANR